MVDFVTSRELVRKVFASGTLPRIPFIPWICSHAAKLEQITTRKMLTDPTQLSKALQNAQILYNYDAVTCVFDPTLEAEACGCPITWGENYEMPSVLPHPAGNLKEIAQLDISDIEKRGRLPIVLEATRRLKIVLGRKVAVIGVAIGPLTIAASLTGMNIIQRIEERDEGVESVLKLAARVTLDVCKAYCGLELDAIMIAEEIIPHLSEKYSDRLRPLLRPVWNIIRFHNAYSIFLTKEGSLNNLEYISDIGADAVVAGVSTSSDDLKMSLLHKPNIVFGAAIPSSLLATKNRDIGEYLTNYLKVGIDRRFFLTTEWEVPSDTYPENLHEVVKTIAQSF